MSAVTEKYVPAEIQGKLYVSVAHAADYLGLHETQVYRLMRQRVDRLESIDWAARVLVEVESLEAEKARRDAEVVA